MSRTARLLAAALLVTSKANGAVDTAASSGLAVSATGATSATLHWPRRPPSSIDGAVLTVQRQYDIPSHKGQWFTVAELPLSATNFTVPGLLEDLSYTFRVCAGRSCSPTASAVTKSASPAPRGIIIADANATFPRQGEVLSWP